MSLWGIWLRHLLGGDGQAARREPSAQPRTAPQAPALLEAVPVGATKEKQPVRPPEVTSPFSLARVEQVVDELGYRVRRQVEDGHVRLVGTWDSFPFTIEELERFPHWLLVAGEWSSPAPYWQRADIAACANDWNRDKFFPTVCVLDDDQGVVLRASYLVNLSAGATGTQLRVHLERGLSSCTQALAQVGPLLPES